MCDFFVLEHYGLQNTIPLGVQESSLYLQYLLKYKKDFLKRTLWIKKFIFENLKLYWHDRYRDLEAWLMNKLNKNLSSVWSFHEKIW
jgi:hypothetical protein